MVKSTTQQSAGKRVLIAGKGLAGRTLAEDVQADGDVVVGFLDDHAQDGDVLGSLDEVASVCRSQHIDVVYFAIPSAPAEVVREFVARVPRPEVELAIIPRTYRVVSRDRVSVSDLTDVDVLDFVGRAPVKHDMEKAREQLRGKRVLVTGAAGSIGSRVLAQLAALEPELIIGLDRAESAVFHLGRSLADQSNVVLEIGDVQSEPRIKQVLQQYQPEYVFHVAAYKHVPLMQANPVEAFNNNVWGTLNVMRSAAEHGVSHAVYVSTDKAVNPTNVMGATKRLGELLLRDLGSMYPNTRFSGVRFGNVLESEGSVMQIFRRQLAAGHNLTVTHPDINRFFMTIDEAAQLIIQSASLGSHGDLFVLDMGEPIRVVDLAQGLINAVNPSLGIDVVGLRPGEKMYEELSYEASEIDQTSHPKIMIMKEREEISAGVTLNWAEALLRRTRECEISNEDLVSEMRAFGFNAIQ
ncbi:MAG: polysaccharide biosynthesis protein [Agromyces sp.]